MNRKNKHISKYLRDPLPDPEIPADDAWAGMNGMLDAAAGQGSGTHGGQAGHFWKSIFKLKGLLAAVSGVAIVSAVAILVVNRHDNPDKESASKHPQIRLREEPETDATGKAAHESVNEISEPAAVDPAETIDSVDIKTGEASAIPGRPIATSVDVEASPGAASTSESAVVTAGRALRARESALKETGEGVRQGNWDKLKNNANSPERNAARPRSNANSIRNASDPAFGNPNETAVPGTAPKPHNPIAGERNFPQNRQQTAERTSRPVADGNDITRIPSNNGPDFNTQSVSYEPNRPSLLNIHIINSLRPLPGRFEGTGKSFAGLVKAPAPTAPQPTPKRRRGPVLQSLHFGPEWGINGDDMKSPYLLTGADSVRRLGRLAIPGLFVTKTWDRHGVTFVFTPLSSYFGGNRRIQRDTDTVLVTDSLTVLSYRNTNFIKATGMNFSLQYEYMATSWLSFNAGVGYATFSRALLRTETENYNGNILQGPLLTVRKSDDFNSYIKNRQWTLRAGAIGHPTALLNGRLQVGTDVVVPVSNLSKNSDFRVRWLNWRIYLRFLIK